MTVYGANTPSYDVIKYWRQQFKPGRNLVKTATIPSRPCLAIDGGTVTKMEAAISEDRRIAIHELAEKMKISVGSI